MRKTYSLLIGLATILLMANCFPKASQVIRALPVESKEQILAQYSASQIAEGHSIYSNSCGNCHKFRKPESRTAEQWNKVIKRMIPKAKLSDEEGKLVRAYVIAHSK